MKYEALKAEVARGVSTKIMGSFEVMDTILIDLLRSNFEVIRALPPYDKHHEKIAEQYADKAFEIIMNWDIRAIKRLRELFREYFPAKFRSCKGFNAEMADNDNCDWMIEPA